MITVGITGIIGSGKSMLSKIFETLQIPVYYSDNEAKALIEVNQEIKRLLILRYGKDIYHNQNTLNKKKLAQIIFNDKKEKDFVNSIVHPVVINDFKNKVKESESKIYAIESALISESKLTDYLNYIIHVYSPEKIRLLRLQKRDNLSKDEIVARTKSQRSSDFFDKISDFKVINDEDNSMILQALEILRKIKEK